MVPKTSSVINYRNKLCNSLAFIIWSVFSPAVFIICTALTDKFILEPFLHLYYQKDADDSKIIEQIVELFEFSFRWLPLFLTGLHIFMNIRQFTRLEEDIHKLHR